jgi:hypothetical protein
MPSNAFVGHAIQPTEPELASVLGKSHTLWQSLVAELRQDLKLDGEEWNSYSIKAGWSLRLQRKKRNIVYLSPRQGYFLAAFSLGDKAIAATKTTKLPTQITKIIKDAKRYAEGTAVRIEVGDPNDIAAVKALARIKVEN